MERKSLILKLFLLFGCVLVSYAGTNCDTSIAPPTWATISAKNVFFNAWQPDNFGNLSGFCVTNDFFSHSLNYYSHVNLANSSAEVHQDVATPRDIDSSKSNCGKSEGEVEWCVSHCSDKTLESLIITSSIVNGSLPLAVAEQVFQQLGNPSDVAIAAIQVDQNNADLHIDYSYYDDKNFCSVYLKIKKSAAFPYVILLTLQTII